MRRKPASRRKPVVLQTDESTRHPGALGKRLMNWCNEHGVHGTTRLILRGVLEHADDHGWAWPGSLALAAYAGCNERTVTAALLVLHHKGGLARIDAHERRGRWPLRGAGGPKSKVTPKARLYLVTPVASDAALAHLERFQEIVGRAAPTSPERTRWALAREAPAQHLPSDIIEMVRKRTLGADDLVREERMRDMVRIADVPYFAAEVPPPYRYFANPAAEEGMTEEELAKAARAGLGVPKKVQRNDGAWVLCCSLPMVAQALEEKRLATALEENSGSLAAAG